MRKKPAARRCACGWAFRPRPAYESRAEQRGRPGTSPPGYQARVRHRRVMAAGVMNGGVDGQQQQGQADRVYTNGCRAGDDWPGPTGLIEDAISRRDRDGLDYSVTGNGVARGGHMLARAQVSIGAGLTRYRRYTLSERFAMVGRVCLLEYVPRNSALYGWVRRGRGMLDRKRRRTIAPSQAPCRHTVGESRSG